MFLSAPSRRDVLMRSSPPGRTAIPLSRGSLYPPGRVGLRALDRVRELRRLRDLARPAARARRTRPPDAELRVPVGLEPDAWFPDERPTAVLRPDLFATADRPGRPVTSRHVPQSSPGATRPGCRVRPRAEPFPARTIPPPVGRRVAKRPRPAPLARPLVSPFFDSPRAGRLPPRRRELSRTAASARVGAAVVRERSRPP